MKRIIAATMAFLCLCLPAFAHPGRTDSKGGHTNRTTGEYHYHHGYPEHQHPDGECPYDFDDKTGASSGSSSSKSGSYYSKPKVTATPKPTRTPKPSLKPTPRPSYKPRTFSFQKIKRGLLIAALLAFPVGICVGMVIGVFIAIGNFIIFLRDNKWTIPFIVLFVVAAVVGLYLIFKHPL